MYADQITRSMRAAIAETERRRAIQDQYNRENGIIPKTVVKGVRDVIEIGVSEEQENRRRRGGEESTPRKLTASERESMIELLTKEMKDAARRLEFEQAAFLRDRIQKLREGKTDTAIPKRVRKKK